MDTAHHRGSSLCIWPTVHASSPPSAHARKEPPRSCLNLPTWSQHQQPHAYTDSTSTREHKPPRHFIRVASTTRFGQHVFASGYAATRIAPFSEQRSQTWNTFARRLCLNSRRHDASAYRWRCRATSCHACHSRRPEGYTTSLEFMQEESTLR